MNFNKSTATTDNSNSIRSFKSQRISLDSNARAQMENDSSEDFQQPLKRKALPEKAVGENFELLRAINYGDWREVKFLLAKPGIDLSTTNSLGQNALHLAAKNDNQIILNLIASHDNWPYFFARDKSGKTALAWAVESRSINAVDVLCKHMIKDFPVENFLMNMNTVKLQRQFVTAMMI